MSDDEPPYRDAAWLHEQLVERERTQAAVAEECGVTPSAICHWRDRHTDSDGDWPVAEGNGERSLLLDAEVGDKFQLTPTEEQGWASNFLVGGTDAVEWVAAAGENWRTRRLYGWFGGPRSHDGGAIYRLSVGAGTPLLEQIETSSGREPPSDRTFRIESVEQVGEAGTEGQIYLREHGPYAEGVVSAEDDAEPDGDDTWQQYYRGESA